MDLFHDSQNPTPPTRQMNFSRANWKVVSAIQSTSEFASNLGIFVSHVSPQIQEKGSPPVSTLMIMKNSSLLKKNWKTLSILGKDGNEGK